MVTCVVTFCIIWNYHRSRSPFTRLINFTLNFTKIVYIRYYLYSFTKRNINRAINAIFLWRWMFLNAFFLFFALSSVRSFYPFFFFFLTKLRLIRIRMYILCLMTPLWLEKVSMHVKFQIMFNSIFINEKTRDCLYYMIAIYNSDSSWIRIYLDGRFFTWNHANFILKQSTFISTYNVFLSPKQKFNCDICLSMISTGVNTYVNVYRNKLISTNNIQWFIGVFKKSKNINSLEILIGKLSDRSARFWPVIHEFVNDFRGTELASCNSIVIYVPSRANRRVQGIGIQHRPGMRNRNLFSFPFPFPLCATQIFYYFPMEPMFSLSLSLSPLFLALFISISLPFFFLSPFLFNRRKKLFAVMSSCKVRLIVVTMFLTLKLLFETSTSEIHGLSKIDDLPSGNYRSIRRGNIFRNQSTPKNRSDVSSAEIWKRCISSSDITRFTLPTSMKLSDIEVNAFY